MNDLERTVTDINKVWLAGFRAGVEAAMKACEEPVKYTGGPSSTRKRAWAECVSAIRSLLNESGAAEKEKP